MPRSPRVSGGYGLHVRVLTAGEQLPYGLFMSYENPVDVPLAAAARRRGKTMDMRSLNRSFAFRRDVAMRHARMSERLVTHQIVIECCPVCGEGGAAPFTTIHGFPYVQCATCELIYTTRPPGDQALRAIYSEEGEGRAAQAKVYLDDDLFARRVAQIATPKVDHVASFVPPTGKWIDIGCATGEILTAARAAGWETLGFETDPGEIAFARARGLTIIEGYLTPDTAPAHLQDAAVVSVLNVIEHVLRPAEFVAGLARAMKNGAHLVLEVPRHPSLSSLSNLLYPDLACRHMYAPEHLHVFSESAMDRILERAEMVPVSVWTFGQDFQELISMSALSAGVPESPFLASVFDLTPRLQQAIDDADFSDSLFVVARKR